MFLKYPTGLCKQKKSRVHPSIVKDTQTLAKLKKIWAFH